MQTATPRDLVLDSLAANARRTATLLSALVGGILVGILDGVVYHGGEPRVPLPVYWSVMLLSLFFATTGVLVVFARHERPDVLVSLGLAVTPGNLVVQDMVSLFVQGTTPWHATWYADYFGDSVLTQHFLGLPGWYYVATMLSLGLIVLAEILHRDVPLALDDDEDAPPAAP